MGSDPIELNALFGRASTVAVIALAVACAPTPRPPGWVDAPRLAAADTKPGDWLVRGGNQLAQHYSPLDRINPRNADSLGFAWEFRPGRRGRVDQLFEATPVVIDGVVYLSTAWSVVFALDAATGRELWRYDPKVEGAWLRRSCCGAVNRGVEVWKGKVYVATLDGWLIALDAATGKQLWRTDTFINRDADYAITSAPHVAGNRVVIGNSGADFGVRGYVSAYHLDTGTLAWRFFTVPGDPKNGFEHPEMALAARTWDPNSSWEAGLGGTVWGEMAYDPELDLLYFGTGNSSPYPIWFRSPSGGDNLFLTSVIAVHPDSGRMVWYYQTVPGEIWDYTATANLVLADLTIGGAPRKVLMIAPKNGFFYVFDRATGKLLSADKFVRVTWAKGVDLVTGKPMIDSSAWYRTETKLVFPSSWGGHNWMPMAFSPKTRLVFIPAMEKGMLVGATPSFKFERHVSYQGNTWGWDLTREQVKRITDGDTTVLTGHSVLQAWDPVARKERWAIPQETAWNGGILATAGDLVVQGRADGHLLVYRAGDGAVLKDIEVGTGMIAAPVTYAVAGTQYLLVAAASISAAMVPGSALTRYDNVSRVIALKLGGGPVPLPPARVRAAVPPPPAQAPLPGSQVQLGLRLFMRLCRPCHDGGGPDAPSTYPDLFLLSEASHASFSDLVLKGLYAANGMASFADALRPDDVTAIHAYVISRQRELFAKEARKPAANR